MQRDYWYSAARAPGDLDVRCGRRPHRGRAHRAPARRAPARHARMPGRVRGARSRRPHRLLRAGGLRRQPVPQVVVPARLARPAGVRAARPPARGAVICCAGAAARRSTAKGSRRCRATSCATASCRATSWARIRARKLGMQSTGNGGGSHNLVLAHGDDDLPRCSRAWARALRHRATGPGRESGDRRLLARRGRLLGRGRRHRLSRSRRSRSPATCATCSATSSRSATTSTAAARGTRAPSSSRA